MSPPAATQEMAVNPDDRFESVIGLEVHAQLLTRTKAFCGCSTEFGGDPNGNVCPVCLGMPGTLPVLNRVMVEFVIRMGLAVGCRISPRSVFARKNYFYPDLPKGYQISQYDEPLCSGGAVEIDLQDGSRKRVGITRIHMEEDAGKSIHDLDPDTLVDVNRCGVPLMEIVSEPDIRSPHEASLYLAKIRQIVTYLGICDGNMEEGSLRCDANVSVRRKGQDRLGTKTEVKNMNSFRNVERALDFEIRRQIGLIEDGGTVSQETLLWDATQNVAFPMRGKEEAHDYRYFPEPDLVPVLVDAEWIAAVRKDLPELPTFRRDRYISEFGLPRYDAEVLTSEKPIADYFERTLSNLTQRSGGTVRENAKPVSNWVMTEILRVAGERKLKLTGFPVAPEQLAGLILLMKNNTISGKIAKEVFEDMVSGGGDPEGIVRRRNLAQVSDAGALELVIDRVLVDHQAQVQKYIEGSSKLFGFFVGETMKLTGGKANPAVVNNLLRKRLDSLTGKR
jgi:aspartyl-tRNA(Asn)/glutamyl-tRNA(Gln) amidotransferase subunit B